LQSQMQMLKAPALESLAGGALATLTHGEASDVTESQQAFGHGRRP